MSSTPESTLLSSAASPAPLESILFTEELNRRPARAPDYATENRALLALTQALSEFPRDILQTLAEKILEVMHVGSAGVSLLSEDEQSFFWPAIAGQWRQHIGGGTPRNFGPCGDVLDCNAPLLFKGVEQRYRYFEAVTPPIEVCLVVPFFMGGKAVGTVWAIAHDELRKFDAEDLRQLESLGRFASAGYQAQRMAVLAQGFASEKLADAVQYGHTLEKLNTTLRASEQALRRSEADLRDFVENAAIGFHWVGADGSILRVNQTELDLLGYTREEYVGHHVADFHADRPAIEDTLARLIRGETVLDYEARMRCKDGAIRHVSVSSNAVFDNDKLVHTRCFTRDITARKQSQAALQASEERVARALDAGELGTFNIDIATSTLIADPRFHAIFGTADDQVDYEGAFSRIHPDDLEQQRVLVAAATRPVNPAAYIGEYRVIHPDHSVHWVFAKGRANFIHAGSDRTAVSLDGTVADITERKAVEEALRESQRFLRFTLDALSGHIAILDESGAILEVNEAWRRFADQNAFTGAEYAVGANYLQHCGQTLAQTGNAQSCIDGINDVISGRQTRFEMEYPCHSPTEKRWFVMWVTRFKSAGPVRIVILHDNCTERKLAESTLRASEEFNRSIVESSPDCIKVLDLDGNLLSLLSGQELLGIDDITPFLNNSWLDFWNGADRLAAQAAVKAAAAGTTSRFGGFFRTPRGDPKWWDVAVSPILGTNGKIERLLSVSRDVTQRQHAEMNVALLAAVSLDLVHCSNVDEMMRTVGAKLAAHFDLSICAFVEIDETAELAVINHDWHRDDVPSLVGTYRLADFVGEQFIRIARSGEAIVVRDTANDTRTTNEKFAALKIASLICMPLLRDRQWQFALCIYQSQPYAWREDEIELTRELTARIWTRLERLRAETALRANQRRLNYAMDSARLTFVEVDLERNSALTADNFAAVMGYSPPPEQTTDVSVGTRLLLEHIVPQDRQRVHAALEEFIGGNPVGKIDYQVLGDDQITRWIESRWAIERGEEGRPLKSFATNFDITERKHAEAALRLSEERYRTLFNSMDEGFCLIDVIFDELNKPVDWQYVDVNPAFEKLTTMQGAVGKRIRQIVPDLEQYWFDCFGNVALTGEPVRFVSEAKSLERWFDIYAFRLGGPESRQIAVLFTNITERIRTAETLKQSEARFRALFDRGPMAMYSCDASGKTLEFNRVAASLWGVEPTLSDNDERFRGLFKFYLPDGTPLSEAKTPMSRVLDGKLPVVHDMQIAFERPDGRRVTVVTNIVPLKNECGEIVGAINCFYDITERSALEHKTHQQAEMLADLSRRKDEFLAMLSHELRNPLAPISNAVQLLRLQKNDDSIQQKARGIIERQVGQLTHLIDDLMEVSRLTTGRIHLHQERLALAGIVEHAVETVRPLIDRHRHSLVLFLQPEPIWLHADAARLEQVIVNLLTNAAKYTERCGSIWLTIAQEGDEAVLRVKDTGVGISSALLPHIFDLFTQADRTLDRSQGGLGIGLSLVQRLVEMHRGTVSVNSTLGEGSEFVVRLPAIQNSALVPASSQATKQAAGQDLRVLVVEDSPDAAATLTMLLELSGHDVQTTHDGLSAITAALKYRPHVVLLDIGLPGLNDFEVAKRLRQQPSMQNVVLVAMTGYGELTARQRSREAGFDHHLVKPADFRKVQEILMSVSAKATS